MQTVFQTNGGLGYRQLAFLIRLDKSENGYNYLCIANQNIRDDSRYDPGAIVKDLEDIYVEPSLFKFEESPLYELFTVFNKLKAETESKRKYTKDEMVEGIMFGFDCCMNNMKDESDGSGSSEITKENFSEFFNNLEQL